MLPPEDDRNDDEDYKPRGETEQEKLAKSVQKDTEKWDRVIRRTKSKIEESQKKQTARIKKRVYHKGYNLNDLVIKKNHQTSGGKLRNDYQGPYVVVGQSGPVTYRIREAAKAGAKEEIQHYNELLPWRRQELQHEKQSEDDESDPVPSLDQPVMNLRRSTRAKHQTQFLQLEEDN